MNYMLTICSDGVATPEKSAAMEANAPVWVDEMDGRGVRLFGRALAPADTAKTVKLRDGEVFVTDGPWTETKEIVAGFDLLDCSDLDEAIEVASKHPVAAFHSVEIRPLMRPGGGTCVTEDLELPDAAVLAGPPAGSERYMLIITVNGIAESDEEEARIVSDSTVWWDQLQERGVAVMGSPLASPTTATTVRVRGGETLLKDGPFAETKEFIAGFCLLDLPSEQEAIELAASHPIARYHPIEVRRFDNNGPQR